VAHISTLASSPVTNRWLLQHVYKGESCDGCFVYWNHRVVFRSVRILCRVPVGGTEMTENWIVAAVAVALIIYLFVALLRPDKF